MHPMMQAFREAQRVEAEDLALAAPEREPAPARTGVTRRDVLRRAGGLVVAIGWLPAARGVGGRARAAKASPPRPRSSPTSS